MKYQFIVFLIQYNSRNWEVKIQFMNSLFRGQLSVKSWFSNHRAICIALVKNINRFQFSIIIKHNMGNNQLKI